MTVAERAAQIWSVLAWAARNRQTLTYGILGQLIGVPARGLAQLLSPIQSYCLQKKLPPLTVIVVGSGGKPGKGFIAGKRIMEEQERVFKRDWLSGKTPTPQDLEEAEKKQYSA